MLAPAIFAGACAFDQTCRDIKITNNSMPDGAVGEKYTGHITVDSNCDWWKLEGDNFVEFTIMAGAVPDGMNMDPKGDFWGLPTTPGIYYFSVRARNIIRFMEARKDLSITIR